MRRQEDAPADAPDGNEWPASGILSVEFPGKVLFHARIDVGPGKLREWAPRPIVLPPELDDDDER